MLVWPISYIISILLVLNILNFFSLITVSQPIVEVIPKLFQNIHMVTNCRSRSACSSTHRLYTLSRQRALTLIFELDSPAVGGQLGLIANILHVPTLNLAILTKTILYHILLHRVCPILIVVVWVTIRSIFLVAICVMYARHWLLLYRVLNEQLKKLTIPLLKVWKSRPVVDVNGILWIELLISPRNKILRVEETIFVTPPFPLIHFDLIKFSIAKTFLFILLGHFHQRNECVYVDAREFLELA